MNQASCGTELEKIKAQLVLDDIEDLMRDHEYDEMVSQVMLKEQCGLYEMKSKLMLYNDVIGE